MKAFFGLLIGLALLLAVSGVRAERTIHVFGVFCNAYEGAGGDINEGVSADKVIVTNLFSGNISEPSWGVTLRQHLVEGAMATKDSILSQFEAFSKSVEEGDTLYVHYSGHGVIPDPQAGEQFLQMVDESLVSRDEWAEAIDALPARLKIFVTDCCSTYPSEFVVAEGDEKVEPWENLHSLLLEHEGFVNITAASPGQPAYGTQYGGFLTINLESDMQRFPTWKEVFESASKRVESETGDQLRAAGLTEFDSQQPLAYSLGRPAELDETMQNRGAPGRLEFVIPDSDRRELSRAELERLGLQQLYLARNEIFARHGYDFSSAFLRGYFGSRSWYRRRPGFQSPEISDLEAANAQLILQVEEDKGGPFINANQAMPGEGDVGAAPDVFPYSSERSIPRAVLQNLTPQQLSIARNEIYARHGYPFQSRVLQNHFAKKPYYYRDSNATDPDFNDVESHNLWLIRKLERINGGAYRW